MMNLTSSISNFYEKHERYRPILFVGLYFALSGTYDSLGSCNSVAWNFFYFTVERLMIVALAIMALESVSNSASIMATYCLIVYQAIQIGVDAISLCVNASILSYLSFVNSFESKVIASIFMTSSLLLMRYLIKKRKRRRNELV